jgi:hypothetical protein
MASEGPALAPIRILPADDHDLVRAGLRSLLSAIGMSVVAQASTEAIRPREISRRSLRTWKTVTSAAVMLTAVQSSGGQDNQRRGGTPAKHPFCPA